MIKGGEGLKAKVARSPDDYEPHMDVLGPNGFYRPYQLLRGRSEADIDAWETAMAKSFAAKKANKEHEVS